MSLLASVPLYEYTIAGRIHIFDTDHRVHL